VLLVLLVLLVLFDMVGVCYDIFVVCV
jgi:hypothetical protein